MSPNSKTTRNGRATDERRLKMTNMSEQRHRQDLFSHRPQQSSSSKQSTSTASEAQQIQKSLMKTQSLLKSELHRISHISNAIDEDETVLRKTMDHHQSLNTKQAQKALTALQRAQQQEQRVLMASIIFFGLTVLYIMWSRVLIKFDVISIILDWMV
ncbi:Sec20 domain family protein [Nitzschia inconspicua]|uniref:Sec20 domain family protein n=1 Tax=Nitzschia inconspicua TaxID=303405 RepID=A0A9K3L9N6_9STRA|nr:Sec20 domain family protein [Nitzschia inconspicua]